MKKILFTLLIATFICSSAFGVDYMSTDKNKTMQAYTITNNYVYGTNDGNKITAVSTSTIVPGTHRIIGYEIAYLDTTKNAELTLIVADSTAAAFKATASGSAATGQFAESESVSGNSLYRIFPYPVELGTQLLVVQGQNTVVTIYYDRK